MQKTPNWQANLQKYLLILTQFSFKTNRIIDMGDGKVCYFIELQSQFTSDFFSPEIMRHQYFF